MAPSATPWVPTPLDTLKGIGPRMAERLERLGIRTVEQLVLHRPLRWEDRSRELEIRAARPGTRTWFRGRILASETRPNGGAARGRRGRSGRILDVSISDDTGVLLLRFFHFSDKQAAALAPGREIRAWGEPRFGRRGLEIVHPELSFDQDFGSAASIVPVYPVTEGLTNPALRKLIDQALERIDELPLIGARPTLLAAINTLHRPQPEDLSALSDETHEALRTLARDELTAHALALRTVRERLLSRPAPALQPSGDRSAALLASLPFELTGAQQRCVAEIRTDLLRARPMLRLLQGDVGAGKTLVAVLAALHCVDAGHQCALMAPTELLAEQHFQSLHRLLEPLGVRVGWLTGRLVSRQRRAELAALAAGQSGIVVGTHALFSEATVFEKLALVMIDEQHRFGVQQRLALASRANDGLTPHQLAMTATPIPRSLAMTHYGDFELSILDELPPGRSPITTRAMPDDRRDALTERVAAAVDAGRQVYWVCPAIEVSETLPIEAVEHRHAELLAQLPQARIGIVHGRQSGEERGRAMAAFKQGELDVLVATTVIEVGVDVPNASLMIIENADRLGLAQLHQLRGRVGRGRVESHCVLLYHPPLSDTGRARLGVLRETLDGFRIAEADLQQRGAGEVLGVRQTGAVQLRFADFARDGALIEAIRTEIDTGLAAGEPGRLRALWLPGSVEYGQV